MILHPLTNCGLEKWLDGMGKFLLSRSFWRRLQSLRNQVQKEVSSLSTLPIINQQSS